MDRREAVLRAIAQVLSDNGHPTPAITDSDPVGEDGLGLDSLDMATVVARLDAELGLDPFARGNASFRTVGDLLRLYEVEMPG